MIDVSGQIKQFIWWKGRPLSWFPFWFEPKDQADVYGLCGVFGVFHNSSSNCDCLKGFKPLVQNDWSSGCVRKSPLKCQNKSSVGKEDGFLKMSDLALPANSKTYQKVSAGRCRLDCIEKCSCMAYTYNNYNGCSLWEGDLINLRQSGGADGRAGAEIYIRLAASEPELQNGGNNKWKIRTTLAVAIPTTLITLGLFMYFRCLCKGKLTRKGKEYTGHDIMLFDFDTNPGPTNNESSSVDNRKKRWSKNMELPLFSYESVSAWKLWSSNKASDLMDRTLGDPPSTSMLLRYINIGLLCVQESPADRPTMSDVILMIVNEHVSLPEPKQPAFVAGRNVAEPGSMMSSAGVPSVNNVTITAIDGR
ncbi:RECEPTOR-LIKE SERINE/THREONINE-PROTEIN KINASE SD1-8 ISOFORM X1 [Salix viminalis]|uniref:RECEPTOR-LIKE SERINE/THREONINE-PROTEIN KINASE SD1-8 ISOFORM X1 n=1 Tax=Salix viminalis TaxID=40686 RepID=A0A9Q0UX26_SALVM|nr:RECEPTOR-LIKE SERINE/THREONINE-PROTEIN KINASE SD1-8 ISOFORM X1 [Salix viminalis]